MCVVVITGVHGEILRNQTTMKQLDTELVFLCHPHIFCIYFYVFLCNFNILYVIFLQMTALGDYEQPISEQHFVRTGLLGFLGPVSILFQAHCVFVSFCWGFFRERFKFQTNAYSLV